MKVFGLAGRPRHYILTFVIIGVSYYLAARIGLLIAFKGTNVSPVWPPAGIALGALLLYGFQFWPAIAIASFFANFSTGLSPVTSLGICMGNTLATIIGTYVVRAFCGERNPLRNSRDVAILLVAGVTCSMIAASIGTIAITYGGYAEDIDPAYLWWTWWLGDTGGVFVLTPLILAWNRRFPAVGPEPKLLQALLLYVITAAIAQIVFKRVSPFGIPLTYLTVPPVVVAAFLYKQRGASVAILLLCAIAVWETVNGAGPFNLGNLNKSLLLIQLFVIVISATALAIAAVVTELQLTADARNELLALEQASRLKAEEALKIKQVLVQEIHHRVKNNLQVISSMLSLQLHNAGNATPEEIFAETRARIRAIALIHERLYRTENLLQIDFGDYARSLCREVLGAYDGNRNRIAFSLDCKDVALGIEKAVPLALILNELLSNSLKHAFPEGRSGTIQIRITKDRGNVVFEFQDDGIGTPQPLNLEDSPTFGLRLIHILTKQIQGENTIDTKKGMAMRMSFPLADELANESSQPRHEVTESGQEK